MKSRVVVLLGPPASGKGTITGVLSKRFGVPVVPPGEIYRRIMGEDTDLANLVRESLKDGGYCPSSLTNRIMKEETDKVAPNGATAIHDGYPRTQEQFDFMEREFDVAGYLHIDAPYEKLVDACANRRKCKGCGMTFSAKNPPCHNRLPEACADKTYHLPIAEAKALCVEYGSEESWEMRWDDGEEFYQRRHNTYTKETQPLLDQIVDSPRYGRFELLGKPKSEEDAVIAWFARVTGLAPLEQTRYPG
jgi:adenylate kinase